jgi:hypothetical protein
VAGFELEAHSQAIQQNRRIVEPAGSDPGVQRVVDGLLQAQSG